MSINRVNISGNLGQDPEMRTTAGGTNILSFSVAVNDRRKNHQSGEWEDYTNWVPCIVFGTRAEPLSRFLSKGSKVAVEGKLRWSQWEDKETGQKRSKIEVIVDEIEFMSRRNDDQQPQFQQQPTYSQPQQPTYQQPQQQFQQQTYQQLAYTAPQPPSNEVYDDEIPF